MKPLSLTEKKEIDRWYPLKDTPIQRALVDDEVRFKVVPAGRRCLESGTDVATPNGPVPIERLKVGDEVIGHNSLGLPEVTRVTATHDNGLQPVIPLLSGNRHYLSGTVNHDLWACNESDFDTRRPHLKKGYDRKPIGDMTTRDRVKRDYFPVMINGGKKSVPLAYALAAFLGDGCSRDNKRTTGQYHRNLYISSDDQVIPSYIAGLIGCRYKKNKGNNYTYSIEIGLGANDRIPFYSGWCSGRYAHDKIADWNEIDTWDKPSALKFLAGIIDTDGSIYFKNNNQREALICISMQAKSVVECCQNIIYKYFQEEGTIGIDSREKYKNGSVYSLKTTSNISLINILSEVDQYLVKKSGFDVSGLVVRNVRCDRIGFKSGEPYEAHTYDITVSNETNLYYLHKGGIVTSNSGKTERAKRHLVKKALKVSGRYFAAAPTRGQAKKIFWADLKLMSFVSMQPKKPSESELIIYMANGSEIHVFGLDVAARIEGIIWDGGVVDEVADLKDGAWESNIKPALDTFHPERPDYQAWCWLIGVPDGLGFYYDLFQYADNGNDPDWRGYTWPSSDILPKKTIEAARRSMSRLQFQVEYEASFENAVGKIYSDYSKANHTDAAIEEHEQLLWSHDQNFTPLSSCIAVMRSDELFILDEIVLTSAVSRQSALEFVEKFKDHKNKKVIIFGDPAGRAGEKHGHKSDYDEMEDVLKAHKWRFERKVSKAAPAIKDRQNSVRARVMDASGGNHLYVNPASAPWSDKALATVQLKKGSTFLEDDTNQYQHISTAIGYMIYKLYGGGNFNLDPSDVGLVG